MEFCPAEHLHDRIHQCTQAVTDGNLQVCTPLEIYRRIITRTNAARRTSQDDCTFLQRVSLPPIHVSC